MKALILYATKYGGTQEVVKRISEKISGSVTHDLKQPNAPDISQFDCVIFGSSVYAGSIRKEAKEYLAQNAELLQKKRLGLFLTGMNAINQITYFNSNFNTNTLQATKAKAFLGGVFDPKKAGFFERIIMWVVTKQSGHLDRIDDKAIEQFVKDLTK
jgi:menaquinone-dependent protoporphyrinogen oxidase